MTREQAHFLSVSLASYRHVSRAPGNCCLTYQNLASLLLLTLTEMLCRMGVGAEAQTSVLCR